MGVLMDFTRTTLSCLNLIYYQRLSTNSVLCVSKLNSCKAFFTYNITGSELHTSVFAVKAAEGVKKDKSITDEAEKKPDKKKKEKESYITLIAPNKHVTVTTLEDASKLAVRRDLKLIKIKDHQTQLRKDRPTYQLMTSAQYLQEEKKNSSDTDKNKSFTKGVKILSVSSKINDHDINAKIKNIIRWLDKRNEVRIAISNDNEESENVYNKIIEGAKELGRVVQKREKGNEIRFQILPLKQETSKSSTSDS